MIGARSLFLLLASCAVLLAGAGPTASAQETSPPGTTPALEPAPIAQVPSSTDSPDTTTVPQRRRYGPTGADRDRLEFGAAVVNGPFDLLGTVGYHRFIRTGGPFEQWVHLELAGGATDYLREGAVSLGYLLRPLRTVRREGRIQPILELGPTGHLVVQLADVKNFDETAFHSRAFMKVHAYAGFDLILGSSLGLVARGRFTVPANHPLDYAQIALFLR